MKRMARWVFTVLVSVITWGGAQASVLTLSDWSDGTSLSDALEVSGNSNAAAFATLAEAYSGTDVYITLTMTVSSSSVLSNNDFVSLWLDNTSTGDHTTVPNFGIKADVLDAVTSSDVFARTTGVSGAVASGSNLVAGESFTVIVHLSKSSSSGTYDTIELWFNPTSDDTASTADVTYTGSSGLTSFSMIGIRSANLDSGDSVTISNVKVATTWAEVAAVPEPSQAAMLVAGLVMMGFMVRRRIRL